MKNSLFRLTGSGLGSVIGVTAVMTSLTLLGQGTVNFGNDASCRVTNAATGQPISGDLGLLAALYSAPLGSTNFVQVGAAVTVGVPVPGVFYGGTRTTTNPPGQRARFQVRAWSGVFSTFEQALAAAAPTATSPILEMAVGGGGTPPMVPSSLTAGGLQGFLIQGPGGSTPAAPTVATAPATSITSTSAVLNASVAPNGLASIAWFEWGNTTNYGTTTITQNLGIAFSFPQAQVSGLQPGTVYHYRIRATNSSGPALGADRSFAWNSNRPSLATAFNQPSNLLTLSFTGAVGQTYLVQTSTNLANWSTLGIAQDLQSSAFRFEDHTSTATKFYRLFMP